MKSFRTLVQRDLLLAVREGGATGTALGFYLVVIALMPLGLGPDLQLLSRIAPGVLWIGLLLAALLSLGRMFDVDQEEGVLEVLTTGALPLELVVAAKALAHWLTTGLPLVVASTGGALGRQAESEGTPFLRYEQPGQPRAAIGFGVGLIHELLVGAGLLTDPDPLGPAVEALEAMLERNAPGVETDANPA